MACLGLVGREVMKGAAIGKQNDYAPRLLAPEIAALGPQARTIRQFQLAGFGIMQSRTVGPKPCLSPEAQDVTGAEIVDPAFDFPNSFKIRKLKNHSHNPHEFPVSLCHCSKAMHNPRLPVPALA